MSSMHPGAAGRTIRSLGALTVICLTNSYPKYIAKADNGYRHSKGFTFMDFHEPIMITARNAATLQDNCLRCHADFVHDIVRGSTTREDAVKCVHCHRGAGHGARP